MQRLLKSIENKVRFGRPRYPPPHDVISERIDDEGSMVLPCFSSGLFRAMFAMKEIWNGKEVHRRVSS
jgi:hypothetical protein